MPFKANADRRHHIPRQRHRVTNSAAYDAALRQRGSLSVWFTDAAIAVWKAEPHTTRGGQPRTSALAIATALTLRAVFRLALRQTEAFTANGAYDQEGVYDDVAARRWQRVSGYHWRALVEADMSRFKRVIADALRSQTDRRRSTEVAIVVAALNRMLELGRPEYIRLP